MQQSVGPLKCRIMHKRYHICVFKLLFILFSWSGCISVAFCFVTGEHDFLEYMPEAWEGFCVPYFDASGTKRWELLSRQMRLVGPRHAQLEALTLTYYAKPGQIHLEAAQAELSEDEIGGTQGAWAQGDLFFVEGRSWQLSKDRLCIQGQVRARLKSEMSLEGLLMPLGQ